MSKMTAWVMTVGGKLAANSNQTNALVTAGDDVSDWLISAYVRGLMGDDAPNVDRIGNERLVCTDAYCQQTCAKGRMGEGHSTFLGHPRSDCTMR